MKRTFEYDFRGRKIIVETGELAKQAHGAVLETTAVESTTVSPYLTKTAPWACLASSPVSITIFLPLKSYSNVFFILPP